MFMQAAVLSSVTAGGPSERFSRVWHKLVATSAAHPGLPLPARRRKVCGAAGQAATRVCDAIPTQAPPTLMLLRLPAALLLQSFRGSVHANIMHLGSPLRMVLPS